MSKALFYIGEKGVVGKLQLVHSLGCNLVIKHIKSVFVCRSGSITFDEWLFAQNGTLYLSELQII